MNANGRRSMISVTAHSAIGKFSFTMLPLNIDHLSTINYDPTSFLNEPQPRPVNFDSTNLINSTNNNIGSSDDPVYATMSNTNIDSLAETMSSNAVAFNILPISVVATTQETATKRRGRPPLSQEQKALNAAERLAKKAKIN